MKSAMFRAESKEQESLPTRGAWIEMTLDEIEKELGYVAPHTGSVD